MPYNNLNRYRFPETLHTSYLVSVCQTICQQKDLMGLTSPAQQEALKVLVLSIHVHSQHLLG